MTDETSRYYPPIRQNGISLIVDQSWWEDNDPERELCGCGRWPEWCQCP